MAMYLPLVASDRVLGVLGIQASDPDSSVNPPVVDCWGSSPARTAAALERLALTERSRQTSVEFEAERLRKPC